MVAVRAVQISHSGGPEALEVVDAPEPKATRGEIVIDVSFAGVNYRDTHLSEAVERSGGIRPLIPGMEVVGRAPDGTRVAAVVPRGGYAERVAAPAALAVPVPDEVDDLSALALLVQGTTAWLLVHECARLRAGDTVLVQAAAGGVGSLLVQLARAGGAGRVVGLASTPAKRELVKDLGAHDAVDSGAEDWPALALRANGGQRFDLVCEMTGGRSARLGRSVLAPLGRMVSFGLAGRHQPDPVDPAELMNTSTMVGGLMLEHAMDRPGLLQKAIGELFDEVAAGRLHVVSGGVHPLSEARRVHEELAARRTVGKLALDPRR